MAETDPPAGDGSARVPDAPFRIVPPPKVSPSTEAAAAREAAAPVPAAVPPPPPPPPAAPALGSRRTFYLLGGAIALTGVGWPWRGAAAEDWLAGAAFLSAFPALLTVGDRGSSWRRFAGIALWLGGLACASRYVRGETTMPPLETMIVAVLGAICSGGGAYLGLWGADREEVLWGRFLSPLGGVLVCAAALTWTVPESRGWLEVLSLQGGRAWSAWWISGGAWRWGGLAVLIGAVGAVRRRKTDPAKPADRTLNWNQ
jgi:hypothetical protein